MGGRHSTVVAFLLRAQPARVQITAPEFFSDIAVLINGALLRTSGQCKKLNIVDQTHPALVRTVMQKVLLRMFRMALCALYPTAVRWRWLKVTHSCSLWQFRSLYRSMFFLEKWANSGLFSVYFCLFAQQ